MEELENKYIELLLKRCLSFEKTKSLFISCKKQNEEFVQKIVLYAKNMGIDDIYIDCEDVYELKEKLLNIDINDIENDKYFDKSIWNEYAIKGASFLMIESETPNILDDVDKEKFNKAIRTNKKTRQIFREKETTYQISWCIAAYPNELWAKSIFPNDENAYEKLLKVICEICMVDESNPIESWNEYLNTARTRASQLDSLEIKMLNYKNSLGTDLKIVMPKNHAWKSVADDGDGTMIVNMPSYEVFSAPDYRYTEGIVYSSRPLIYAGSKIDEFYLKFENGKVVDFGAKEGYETLKGILEGEEQAKYLGEVALVENDSPISNTGLVFGSTLLDENASCHLALGNAYPDCIKTDTKKTDEELMELGLNHADITHVDFMIGTPDLTIEAETNKGKILIFKDGNFNI